MVRFRTHGGARRKNLKRGIAVNVAVIVDVVDVVSVIADKVHHPIIAIEGHHVVVAIIVAVIVSEVRY